MASELETTPRKTPKQSRSRATVDAILTATAQLLVDHGYDKTTTNAVARRAGVSIGSLYQYFPNKEALVSALCERHMEQSTRFVTAELEVLDRAPLAESIHRLIEALLKMHAVEPELHRVLIEQIPRLSGFDAIARLDRMMVELIRHKLEQRTEKLRPDNIELAVFILVHSVQAVTHAAVLDRPDALDDDHLANELTDLVVRYLVE